MQNRSGSKSEVWIRRLGWMAVFWACSVAALGAAAWLLKLLMRAAGMH